MNLYRVHFANDSSYFATSARNRRKAVMQARAAFKGLRGRHAGAVVKVCRYVVKLADYRQLA